MPGNCSVATCTSSTGGRSKKNGVSMFRFPKDKAIQAIWVHKCARQDFFSIQTGAICSEHFTEADYDPSYLVKRALVSGARPSLKPDAIPSKNLPSSLSR